MVIETVAEIKLETANQLEKCVARDHPKNNDCDSSSMLLFERDYINICFFFIGPQQYFVIYFICNFKYISRTPVFSIMCHVPCDALTYSCNLQLVCRIFGRAKHVGLYFYLLSIFIIIALTGVAPPKMKVFLDSINSSTIVQFF